MAVGRGAKNTAIIVIYIKFYKIIEHRKSKYIANVYAGYKCYFAPSLFEKQVRFTIILRLI